MNVDNRETPEMRAMTQANRAISENVNGFVMMDLVVGLTKKNQEQSQQKNNLICGHHRHQLGSMSFCFGYRYSAFIFNNLSYLSLLSVCLKKCQFEGMAIFQSDLISRWNNLGNFVCVSQIEYQRRWLSNVLLQTEAIVSE